jgi:hypothetical protein
VETDVSSDRSTDAAACEAKMPDVVLLKHRQLMESRSTSACSTDAFACEAKMHLLIEQRCIRLTSLSEAVIDHRYSSLWSPDIAAHGEQIQQLVEPKSICTCSTYAVA